GLRAYFDVVIGYEDVTPPKPAPDPLLAAIGQLGLSRTHSIYVGDSMVDLETGRAARVRTVLAAGGLTPEARVALRPPRLWALRCRARTRQSCPTSSRPTTTRRPWSSTSPSSSCRSRCSRRSRRSSALLTSSART